MEVPVFRHEAQTLHVPKTVSLGLTGLPFASSPDLPFWSRACALVFFAHSGEHGLLRFRLSMFLTLQAPFAAGGGRNEKLGFRPWALVRSCSARAFCLKNTHPRLGLHAACRAPRKWNGLVYCRTLSMRTEVTQMMLAQCFITWGLGLCVYVCVCVCVRSVLSSFMDESFPSTACHPHRVTLCRMCLAMQKYLHGAPGESYSSW